MKCYRGKGLPTKSVGFNVKKAGTVMKSSNYRIFFWNHPVQRYWILFECAGCELFSALLKQRNWSRRKLWNQLIFLGNSGSFYRFQYLPWGGTKFTHLLYYAFDIVVKTLILFGAEYPQCWYLEHGTANAMFNKNTDQSISPLTAVNFIAKLRTTIQTQRIGTGKNKYNQVIMMLTRHVKKHGHKG